MVPLSVELISSRAERLCRYPCRKFLHDHPVRTRLPLARNSLLWKRQGECLWLKSTVAWRLLIAGRPSRLWLATRRLGREPILPDMGVSILQTISRRMSVLRKPQRRPGALRQVPNMRSAQALQEIGTRTRGCRLTLTEALVNRLFLQLSLQSRAD